ncbi:CoA transferase [Roseixanthobacter liquoris]|uniref:CoA transferase n=1 Tax=Roseixanthobacter liquoris TaxID=3119921 RepID=UPI00372A137B
MTYDLLRGMRIVESSAFIAAPLGGLTLAQYGADVIRCDAIGGGIDYGRLPLMPSGRSLYWTSLNKGKRSIAVDIRRPEGRELIRGLVTAPGASGGILLTNIASEWLSYDRLSAARADVISCVIEGSSDGTTAVDYTVNCATGYPAMTGGGSLAAPTNHALPAWDVACALQASSAILAAILRRRESGAGADIRLALSDAAFSTLAHLGLMAEVELTGKDRPALGNDVFGAFGRDFATRDKRRIMVVAISARQWAALVRACGLGAQIAAVEAATGLDFAREADRFHGRDVIAALVKLWIEARTLAEVAETFDTHAVCWGKYQTVASLMAEDARVSLANPVFEQIETKGVGRHISAGTPVRFADLERHPTRSAPYLGENTDEVLADVLGLSSAAIGRLHDAGIVAGPALDPTFDADRSGAARPSPPSSPHSAPPLAAAS